jgi:hypothetical protein
MLFPYAASRQLAARNLGLDNSIVNKQDIASTWQIIADEMNVGMPLRALRKKGDCRTSHAAFNLPKLRVARRMPANASLTQRNGAIRVQARGVDRTAPAVHQHAQVIQPAGEAIR